MPQCFFCILMKHTVLTNQRERYIEASSVMHAKTRFAENVIKVKDKT